MYVYMYTYIFLFFKSSMHSFVAWRVHMPQQTCWAKRTICLNHSKRTCNLKYADLQSGSISTKGREMQTYSRNSVMCF